ncbi:hypothetical protein V8C43DRAFT_204406 [Trichoderma afarasin]
MHVNFIPFFIFLATTLIFNLGSIFRTPFLTAKARVAPALSFTTYRSQCLFDATPFRTLMFSLNAPSSALHHRLQVPYSVYLQARQRPPQLSTSSRLLTSLAETKSLVLLPGFFN